MTADEIITQILAELEIEIRDAAKLSKNLDGWRMSHWDGQHMAFVLIRDRILALRKEERP